jgi:cytochrome oxidase Cu insertion factor (SCO1/SenC/PrrC family)
MKKYSMAVAAGILLFAAVSGYAQEKKESQQQNPPVTKLTVEQAVEYADSNSRTLKSAQIDLEMKKRCSAVFMERACSFGKRKRYNVAHK